MAPSVAVRSVNPEIVHFHLQAESTLTLARRSTVMVLLSHGKEEDCCSRVSIFASNTSMMDPMVREAGLHEVPVDFASPQPLMVREIATASCFLAGFLRVKPNMWGEPPSLLACDAIFSRTAKVARFSEQALDQAP